MIGLFKWIAFREWLPIKVRVWAIAKATEHLAALLASATPDQKRALIDAVNADPDTFKLFRNSVDRY